MEPWLFGLIAFAVIGLAALLLANRADRRRAREIRETMSNPPDRPIPALGDDAPSPDYLLEEQAFTPPPGAEPTELDEDTRQAIRAQLTHATRIDGGYPRKEFATDTPTGWAVLYQPSVLVSNDEIVSLRELLPVIAASAGRPLVLVAPGFSRDVIDTLAVNRIQDKLAVCPVVTDHDPADLAHLVGGAALDGTDLQAGYVPASALGQPGLWVSARTESWLIR
jgi:hypothetical protein